LIGFVFFISFEKCFEMKRSQSGKNGIGLYFLIFEKRAQDKLSLIDI
jgi:hypothetical protein